MLTVTSSAAVERDETHCT